MDTISFFTNIEKQGQKTKIVKQNRDSTFFLYEGKTGWKEN